jgi:hypothetical protein
LIPYHLPDMFEEIRKCSMGSHILRNSLTRIRLGNRLTFTVQSSWQRCEHSKKSSGLISASTGRPTSTPMIPRLE